MKQIGSMSENVTRAQQQTKTIRRGTTGERQMITMGNVMGDVDSAVVTFSPLVNDAVSAAYHRGCTVLVVVLVLAFVLVLVLVLVFAHDG